MYNGKEGETVTNTFVRIYQNQKVKQSTHLISDEKTANQHILCRASIHMVAMYKTKHYYYWYITDEGNYKPVWYEDEQLPASLNRRKSAKSTSQNTVVSRDCEADNEDDEERLATSRELVLKTRRRTATPPPESDNAVAQCVCGCVVILLTMTMIQIGITYN